MTALVYARVLGFDFVNFDDPDYVTLNPHVRAGIGLEGLVWAALAYHASNWHPLTWLSHMADFTLYGEAAGGHHATSVVLHLANTALVYAVLAAMTRERWRSLAVAAVFALHPTHVESVAWVSERKDVLSTLFWWLTIAAYLRWVREPSRERYALVAVALALGLMAKPMLVSLPVVLLVLDAWPLGRLAPGTADARAALRALLPRVAEKLPLFALCLAAGVVVLFAQHGGSAVVALDAFPSTARLANAVVSLARYPALLLWPANLAPFYPLRAPSAAQLAGALALVLVLTGVAVRTARSRPYLLAGWLWYVASVLPVLGIVQVGMQSHADRYTYIPSIGLTIAVVWGLADLARARPAILRPAWLASLAAVVVGACAWLTWQQVGHWRDSETLFSHTLAVTEDNSLAHANLAAALATREAYDQAHEHWVEAVRLRPTNVPARIGLANSLRRRGDTAGAEALYRDALATRPDVAPARNALATLLADGGDHEGALREYRAAVAIDPDFPDAWANLGRELLAQGRRDEALSPLTAALRLRPDWNDVRIALGAALLEGGDVAGAIEHLRRAVELDGASAEARFQLGTALVAGGSAASAAGELEEARRLDPNRADVAHHLGIAQAMSGRREAALESYAAALALEPGYAEVRYNRALTLSELGRGSEAEADLRAVLALRPDDERAAELLRSLTASPP